MYVFATLIPFLARLKVKVDTTPDSFWEQGLLWVAIIGSWLLVGFVVLVVFVTVASKVSPSFEDWWDNVGR